MKGEVRKENETAKNICIKNDHLIFILLTPIARNNLLRMQQT